MCDVALADTNVVLANSDDAENHQDEHHQDSVQEHYRWECDICRVALFVIPRDAEIHEQKCYQDVFHYDNEVVEPVMLYDCIHRLRRYDRSLKALKYSPDHIYYFEKVFGDDDYDNEMASLGTLIGENIGIKVLSIANEDNFTPHGGIGRFYEEISASSSIEYLHFSGCLIDGEDVIDLFTTPKLNTIRMIGCEFKYSFEQAFAGCTNVTSLDFINCNFEANDSLSDVISGFGEMKSLQVVKFHTCSMSEDDKTVVQRLALEKRKFITIFISKV